jgi:hypothetical protein
VRVAVKHEVMKSVWLETREWKRVSHLSGHIINIYSNFLLSHYSHAEFRRSCQLHRLIWH